MKTKLFAFIAIASLCSFAGDYKIFETSKWLPEGFDARKTVLLVEAFKFSNGNKNLARACENITNDMKALVKERYTYKHEFINPEDIATKYTDKETYRYVVMWENGLRANSAGDGMYTNVFHIYDRKADKHYPETSKTAGSVLPILGPTMSAINTHLKGLKGETAGPAQQH